ncbi:MAG: alpha/beta hydrolase [Treponema sp.]|jgi:acetyl esterase/lipase|nr:alpha/beta hydrolase [Treponema sp.]
MSGEAAGKSGISTTYRFLEFAVRLLGLKKIFSLDEEKFNKYIEKNIGKRKTAPPGFVYRNNLVREWVVDGRPCYILTPRKGADPEKTVLFLHGGGMIMEAHIIHWIVAARITKSLGAAVWVPAYPLAPGHNFKEITEILLRIYGKMREENPGSEFIVMGDSAGGTLALMLCHHNKALGMPLPIPKRLILVSPGAFVRKDNRTIRDEMDRILPRDSLVSPQIMDVLIPLMGIDPGRGNYFDVPMEGDFSGFPDMYVFFGTSEIFFALAPSFIDRVKAGGVPVKLYIGEGMMHVWPYMPISRECRGALKTIFDIIKA